MQATTLRFTEGMACVIFRASFPLAGIHSKKDVPLVGRETIQRTRDGKEAFYSQKKSPSGPEDPNPLVDPAATCTTC